MPLIGRADEGVPPTRCPLGHTNIGRSDEGGPGAEAGEVDARQYLKWMRKGHCAWKVRAKKSTPIIQLCLQCVCVSYRLVNGGSHCRHKMSRRNV